MSERVTIGGTVYESVGSSTSNLLLKCNGTARIQWGNKLIDLIKNGKIATSEASTPIMIVSDQKDIKQDGIYLLQKEKSQELWISKKGEQYNLTGADLYISASTKQDITAEQSKQALENLRFYYNTLEELQNAGIQNGLAYVLDTSTLYTINNSIVSEFEAKIKTVTVEKEEETGEVINSQYRIVLSVLDTECVVVESDKITANCSICIDNSAQLSSSGASEDYGYRLYIDHNSQSWLEVDNIKIRNQAADEGFTRVTYDELSKLISSNQLEPNTWYLLENFQNHWKLPKNSKFFNRPLLLQAASNSTLCKQGYLWENQNIVIHYDVNFVEFINVLDTTTIVTSRGKIVWMKDILTGNEANFDFLDYTDCDRNELTTLHLTDSGYSVFPEGSYNNKLIVSELSGTIIKSNTNDDGTIYYVDKASETQPTIRFNCLNMHDNTLCGTNIFINESCQNFVSNNLLDIGNLTVSGNLTNSTFELIENCEFIADLKQVSFKGLSNCVFQQGVVENVRGLSDLNDFTFSQEGHALLYNPAKYKEMYVQNSQLIILCPYEQMFVRGMIVMHSGLENIPEGWAICDGNSYTFNGVTSTTPNLLGRFIKATDSVDNIQAVDVNVNNEVTLSVDNLPAHSHPHKSHTHSFAGSDSQTISTSTSATSKNAITSIEGGTSGFSGDDVTIGNVSVDISISGTTESATSQEDTQTWENTPFSIEPNYYSLIFIMKL